MEETPSKNEIKQQDIKLEINDKDGLKEGKNICKKDSLGIRKLKSSISSKDRSRTKESKEEKETIMILKIKIKSFFGCTTVKNIKLKCVKDSLIFISFKEDKQGNHLDEKQEMSIPAQNFINSSLYQYNLTERNSFSIFYYLDDSKKLSSVTHIRVYTDNRWENERYCLKLKDLYQIKNTNLFEVKDKDIQSLLKYSPKDLYTKSFILLDLIEHNHKKKFFYNFYLKSTNYKNFEERNDVIEEDVEKLVNCVKEIRTANNSYELIDYNKYKEKQIN